MQAGIIRDPKQGTQRSDEIQDIHESGRIIGKSLRGIECPGTYGEDPVSPRSKTGNIIAETVGGISKDQTKQQGSPENDPDEPGNVLEFTFVFLFSETGIADTAQKQ
jgi:hypothetical protein